MWHIIGTHPLLVLPWVNARGRTACTSRRAAHASGQRRGANGTASRAAACLYQGPSVPPPRMPRAAHSPTMPLRQRKAAARGPRPARGSASLCSSRTGHRP